LRPRPISYGMDIFSHGLWAGAAAQAGNVSEKAQGFTKRRISVWWTVVWGVFPDLFAFTIPFMWIMWQTITGQASFGEFRPPHEPAQPNSFPMFALASSLYNISHSVIIFFLLFGVVFFIFKRPVWEMMGALIHILSDIPTHSYSFFPTPFLWPLSDFKVNGISWGTPWFMVLNYSAIVLVYTLIYRKKKTALAKN